MLPMFRRLSAAWQRLSGDRRGNVLMIFGFALVPITFATGMTIDYARAARVQTRLNAVTDAAALAAVTPLMMKQTRLQAATAAANMWYAQAGITQCQGGTVNRVTFNSCGSGISTSDNGLVFSGTDGTLTMSITDNTSGTNLKRTVTMSYVATSQNIFGSLLSSATIPIGGTVTSRAGGDTFFQIVFVVDVSSSMAIGGTASDVNKLANDRTIQCSFACHDPNGTVGVAASNFCDANPLNAYCRYYGPLYCPYSRCTRVSPSETYSDRSDLARLYGYKLKIDYVKDAVNNFITQLKPKMDLTPQFYNVGIDTFGTKYARLQTMTSNSTTLQTAANKLDVEVATLVWPSPNQGWTYTSNGLASALSNLSNIGDGSATNKRATYIIFMSDGVEDIPGNIIYGRTATYDYAQKCQAAKNAGVTMFSIEAAYPVVTDDDDGQYQSLVGNLPSRNGGKQLADVMKACASGDDKYFMATDGPDINDAVNEVFTSIFGRQARLAQ